MACHERHRTHTHTHTHVRTQTHKRTNTQTHKHTNTRAHPLTQAVAVDVDLPSLGFPDGAKVRDVWALKDLGTFHAKFSTRALKLHDSALLVLSPP